MSPADAIAYARKVKASWPPEKLNNAPKVARALIAMLELCERPPAQHPRGTTKPRKGHRTARQTAAWGVMKGERFARNVLPGVEGEFVLAIYATRDAARRFHCLNNGEKITPVCITVT